MTDKDETIFTPDEQETDEEAYAPEYDLSERSVFTTPADPDVQTILNRIDDKSLVLRPEFQRAEVWDVKRKSRLIESLLLNLPIPPCFLAEDEDGTRVVVDGQQRFRAIDDFYHGRYALKGLQVLKDLNDHKWSDLPPKLDRKILQRVVRTLVISHHSNPGIKFEIFERLNTGGEPLTEQEIRNATLRGRFNQLLNSLAESKQFLTAMGVNRPDIRLRHHELVLRFFAVRDALEDYKPPLKMILTDYMRLNREPDASRQARFRSTFEAAIHNSVLVFGEHAFKRYRQKPGEPPEYERAVSKAVFELQMISLSYVSQTEAASKRKEIKAAFENLSLQSPQFSDSLSRATDHRSRFYERVRLWSSELNRMGVAAELNARLERERAKHEQPAH